MKDPFAAGSELRGRESAVGPGRLSVGRPGRISYADFDYSRLAQYAELQGSRDTQRCQHDLLSPIRPSVRSEQELPQNIAGIAADGNRVSSARTAPMREEIGQTRARRGASVEAGSKVYLAGHSPKRSGDRRPTQSGNQGAVHYTQRPDNLSAFKGIAICSMAGAFIWLFVVGVVWWWKH